MCAAPVSKCQNLDVGSTCIPIEDCAWEVYSCYVLKGRVSTSPKLPRIVALSEWFPEPSCCRIIYFIYPGSNEQVLKCAEIFRKVAAGRRIQVDNPFPNGKKFVAIGITPDRVFQIVFDGGRKIELPIPNLQDFLQNCKK